MLKLVAAAAVAAVVVTGMPAVSEAGHERGERTRDCRICKAMSDFRAKLSERRARPAPVAVRTERRVFEWPKLPPRDPLFKLLPREPRPARVVVHRERAPLFVHKPRERAPLFVRKERGSYK